MRTVTTVTPILTEPKERDVCHSSVNCILQQINFLTILIGALHLRDEMSEYVPVYEIVESCHRAVRYCES